MANIYKYGLLGIGTTTQLGRRGGYVNWGGGINAFRLYEPDGVTPANIRVAATPIAVNDATSKSYVDGLVQGLAPKDSVRTSITTNIPIAGTGVGATFDGVVLALGDRVLVMGQTLPAENGIYDVGAGSLTRSTDADTGTKMGSAFTFVEEGTIRANRGYTTTFNSTDTLGTSPMPWVQFSNAGAFTASQGVQLVTNDFRLDINGLSTQNSIVPANDLISFYDASVAGTRKISFASAISTLSLMRTTGDTMTGNLIMNGANILADLGTALVPSVSFNSDSDTGMYRPAANTIGLTAGGANQVSIANGAGVNASVSLSATDAITLNRGTTAQRPSTPVNGMMRYNSTLNQFEGYEGGSWDQLLTTGSTSGPFVLKSGDTMTGNLIMNGANILADLGTALVPSVSFNGDPDTGMYRPSANTIGLTAGGIRQMTITDGAGVSASINLRATDAIRLTRGTTAQRPSTPANGMMRYNSTLNQFEGYEGGSWDQLLTTGSTSGPFVLKTGDTMSGNLVMNAANILADLGTALVPSVSFNGDPDTGIYRSAANSIGLSAGGIGQVSITNGAGVNASVSLSATDAITLNRGTTAQRPSTPVNGMMRYNSTLSQFEGYESGTWDQLLTTGSTSGPFVLKAGDTMSGNLVMNGANILADFGTALAPSVSFNGDTDTGMYRLAANTIGLSAGGIGQVSITNGAGVNASVSLSATDAITLNRGTTAQRPSTPVNGMMRYNSTNSEFEGYASGSWGPLAGAAGAYVLKTGDTMSGNLVMNAANILADLGTALVPSVAFNGDPDTGIYRPSANTIGLTAGGIRQMTITNGAGINASINLRATDAIRLTRGTTAQRPSTPANGMMRYNTTNSEFEGYASGSWGPLAGAAGAYVLKTGDTMSGNLIMNAANILADLGTALVPSVSFNGDTDTGMYRSTANTIGLTAGGIGQVSITNGAGVNASVSLSATDAITLTRGTTAQRPSTPVNGMMRYNSTNSEFEGYASGSWGPLAGAAGAYVLKTGDTMSGNLIMNGANILADLGTALVPSVSFNGDPDTGMYRPSANTIGLSTGGVESVMMSGAVLTKYRTDNVPAIQLERIGTPAVANVGRLDFNGLDSASTTTDYVRLVGAATDITAGAASGSMSINIRSAGAISTVASFVNNQAQFLDGSTAAPSIAFQSDPDTGMYRPAANTIGLVTGGIGQVSITNGAGVNASVSLSATDAITLNRGTTAQRPSTPANGMMRYNTTNSEFEGYASGSWGPLAGAAGAYVLKTGDTMSGNLIMNGANILADFGTALVPSVSFNGDPDTGMYRSTANTIGLTAGGIRQMTITDGAGINASVSFRATDAIRLTRGTTAQRPSTPANGMMRYNSTLNQFEGYAAGAWDQLLTTGSTSGPFVLKTGDTMTGNLIMNGANILADLGTALVPSVSFNGDPDTGMYRSAANSIGLTAGGVESVMVSGAVLTKYRTDNVPAIQLERIGTPAVATVGRLDYNGLNSLSVSTDYARVVGTATDITAGTESGSVSINIRSVGAISTVASFANNQAQFLDGSTAAPSLTFQSDPDTGMYRPAANTIGLSAGGIGQVSITNGAGINASVSLSATDAITLNRGTTAQRPSTPVNGMMRYNSTNSEFEGYASGSWGPLAGAAGAYVLKTGDTMSGNLVMNGANILADFGTALVPSVSFNGDPDTGMYRSAANNVSISSSGAESTRFGANTLRKYRTDGIPALQLERIGTPAVAGVGRINFNGLNTLSTGVDFARIDVRATDTTAGAIVGSMLLQTATGGVLSSVITLAANQSQFTNGTATLPSVTFQSNPDTGMYRPSANTIGLTAGGIRQMTITDGAGVNASVNFRATDAIKLTRGTTAQRPSTPVDGMMRYNSTLNQFEGYEAGAWGQLLTTASTSGPFVLKTGDTMSGNLVMSGANILADVGTALVPSVSFNGDPDTGIYRPSANSIGLTAGGVESVMVSGAVLTKYRTDNVPAIQLERIGTPAVSTVGRLDYNGLDSLSASTDYARLVGAATDITAGAASGSFTIDVRTAGTVSTVATFANNQSQFTNGTAALPSVTFQSNPDTGMYRPSANTIGLTAGGIRQMTITDGAGVNASVNFRATDAIKLTRGTTAQRPSTPVDGMMRYNSTLNQFEGYEAGAWGQLLTTASTSGPFVLKTGDTMSGNLVMSGANILADAGTALVPSVSFNGDPDTGIYRPSANSIGLTTGGVESVMVSGAVLTKYRTDNVPAIQLERIGTPAVSTVGRLDYNGLNSLSTGVDYARLLGAATDTTTGTESGSFTIDVRTAGTVSTVATFANNQSQFTNGTAALPSVTFQSNPDTGMYRPSANTIGLTAGGIRQMTITDGAGVNASVSFRATDAITLNRGTTAQRPSTPANGMMRYNSTLNQFEGYAAGSWTAINGNTSIFTDNGNGSFTHDDGTGTTVLLDVPSELVNNIINTEMVTLLNNTFDASNTASAAEIAALTGSELMWVELASGNVEKVKMSDLVNPNILPNPNSVGQVFTDWFVGYAFAGDPGGSGGGGLVLPAGPPGVNGHWEAISFPQGFIQLTRTDTLSIIPGAVGVPGDTIGYADTGGGNETVRGGFGWRATS